MELRQLKQFVAVAQTENFSRAADLLHMAQPPLSVAIRKLEEEIGIPLLIRGSRGVKLTAAGQAVLSEAIKCLDSAANISAAAHQAANGEAGILRIGFIGSLTFSLLPKLIQNFSQRYPNIRLELSESTNLGLISMLETGSVDVVFVREPTSHPAGLFFETISNDVFCVAMPTDHPLSRKKSVSLQDLRDENFIGYTPSRVGGLHAAVTHLLHEAGISLRVTQEAVQVQTVVGLVRSGLGLAMVPSINAAFMPNDVAFRPIHDLPESFHIGIALVYRDRNDNPVIQRFVASIQENLDT